MRKLDSWVKTQLETCGYNLTVPIFPTPEDQTLDKLKDVIADMDFDFNGESVVIGHSIGATFILLLLEEYKVGKSIFVTGFTSDLMTESIESKECDVINESFYNENFKWKKLVYCFKDCYPEVRHILIRGIPKWKHLYISQSAEGCEVRVSLVGEVAVVVNDKKVDQYIELIHSILMLKNYRLSWQKNMILRILREIAQI